MVSVADDLNLHFVIVLNPNTPHTVLWFKTNGEKITKDKVFETFKQIAGLPPAAFREQNRHM